MSDACETPLLDLLKAVPKDAVGSWDVSDIESHHVPYGRMCHEAADAIEGTQAELSAALALLAEHKREIERLHKLRDDRECLIVPSGMLWDLLIAIEQVRSARTSSEADWRPLNDADDKLRALIDANEED